MRRTDAHMRRLHIQNKPKGVPCFTNMLRGYGATLDARERMLT